VTSPTNRIVLVTGMSGAGRSTALKNLEDIGYEAVDNLPLSLLSRLVKGTNSGTRPLAVGVDIRSRDFAVELFMQELDRLTSEEGLSVSTLFLDCDEDTLIRRYTETRRRHPLAADRPVADGVRLERRLLRTLRERADVLIDTTALSIWDLKQRLIDTFGADQTPGLSVLVTSFSYRHGLPREADLVFDVRFLRNPHYDAALKPLTGQDPKVGAYIEADPDSEAFLERLLALLQVALPRYEQEGKSYLNIAVGCTGGRHRSVYIAERLTRWLEEVGRPAHLHHRELHRESETEDTKEMPQSDRTKKKS